MDDKKQEKSEEKKEDDETEEDNEEPCCELIDPEKWNKKKVLFKNKLFLKDTIKSMFNVPLNATKVITKNMNLIHSVKAETSPQLMLWEHLSAWKSNVYISLSKEVDGTEMTRLNGTFLTRVFEGPYSKAGKFAKEMEMYVKIKGHNLKKLYFWYTVCPKCAKKFNKNYTIMFAEIE